MKQPEWIVTILNKKTKQCRFEYVKHPEQLHDIETLLEEDEAMYVNEIQEGQ